MESWSSDGLLNRWNGQGMFSAGQGDTSGGQPFSFSRGDWMTSTHVSTQTWLRSAFSP